MKAIDLSPLFDPAVTITKTKDGFTLTCNDGVANEWKETFPSLSVALCRAAALAICQESDWSGLFTEDEAGFTFRAEPWLDSRVTG
jgi:hypothetical protein